MPDHPQPQQAGSPRRSMFLLRPEVGLVVLSVVVYACQVVAPLLKQAPTSAATLGSSFLLAMLSLAVVAVGAAWPTRPLVEALLTVFFLPGWMLAGNLAAVGPHMRLYAGPAANGLFLLSSLFVGKVLSRIVRERAMALPVCVVAAMADLFTVFWGPTGDVLKHTPELVERLSFAIPAVGSAAGPEGAKGLSFVATMGLGDYVFVSLFMSMALRFGFRLFRSYVAMAVGAAVGISVLLVGPPDLRGIPLLPFISGGFVLANLGEFQLTPQERRDLLMALAILVAVFVALAALRL